MSFSRLFQSKSWSAGGVRREESLFEGLKMFPQLYLQDLEKCFHKTLLSLKNGLIMLRITLSLLHT